MNLKPPYVLAAMVCRKYYKRHDGRPSFDGVTVTVTRRNVTTQSVCLDDDPNGLILVVFLFFEEQHRPHSSGYRFVSPTRKVLYNDPECAYANRHAAVFMFPIGILQTDESGWHMFEIMADGEVITKTPLLVVTHRELARDTR